MERDNQHKHNMDAYFVNIDFTTEIHIDIVHAYGVLTRDIIDKVDCSVFRLDRGNSNHVSNTSTMCTLPPWAVKNNFIVGLSFTLVTHNMLALSATLIVLNHQMDQHPTR